MLDNPISVSTQRNSTWNQNGLPPVNAEKSTSTRLERYTGITTSESPDGPSVCHLLKYVPPVDISTSCLGGDEFAILLGAQQDASAISMHSKHTHNQKKGGNSRKYGNSNCSKLCGFHCNQ